MDNPERVTYRCDGCNRQLFQSLDRCPVCGGTITTIERPPKINRPTFHGRKTQCHACIYWGRHRRPSGIATGCGMLAKPCRVELLWLDPKEDWCPMGFTSPDESAV